MIRRESKKFEGDGLYQFEWGGRMQVHKVTWDAESGFFEIPCPDPNFRCFAFPPSVFDETVRGKLTVFN